MTQTARPISDAYNGDGFTTLAGGSSSLYATLDETSVSDADGVQSPEAPAGAVYVTKLGPLTDPGIHTGHVFSYRLGKNTAGGAQVDVVVELRQGYSNETNQGALIASWTHTDANGLIARQR